MLLFEIENASASLRNGPIFYAIAESAYKDRRRLRPENRDTQDVCMRIGKIGLMKPPAVKRSRGRPRVDAEPVHIRIPRPLLAAVQIWIAERQTNFGEDLSRPEALRRLLTEALQARGLLKP